MKNKLLKRGIEPIIAVVILVAVTLVIAVGVIGWLMGWWGALGATEQLQIYGDTELKVSDSGGTVTLHVGNRGSASAVIYKIEIVNFGETTQLTTSSGTTVITVPPGGEAYITATITSTSGGSLMAGANYIIKVYTKAGNTYQITVVAQ